MFAFPCDCTTVCIFIRCVYERATFAPTLAAFTLSAWWHGLYPGYYLCFVYFGFVIEASRKVSKSLSHLFHMLCSCSLLH